jgi:TPR repeat protein
MKRVFTFGLVLIGSLSLAVSPASAQSHLLGLASGGGEYAYGGGHSGISSQKFQQLQAARQFLGKGETDKAIVLLQRLYQADFVPAFTLLGTLHLYGRGVPQDDGLAAQYFAYAAKRGDHGAMYLYGYALDNGLGVKQDRDMAAMWMQRASDSGQIELMKAVRRYRQQPAS